MVKKTLNAGKLTAEFIQAETSQTLEAELSSTLQMCFQEKGNYTTPKNVSDAIDSKIQIVKYSEFDPSKAAENIIYFIVE